VELVLIAAIARNGVIGRDGTLPWQLPADLARFKQLTSGHTIVMGRKTWESIGRPLPKRTNLILSRTLEPPLGTSVVESLDDAIAQARDRGETALYVIGGARVYAEALARADRLELTRVDADVEGDVHFPDWDGRQFDCVRFETHPADTRHAHAFRFETWRRIAP
jgi:dihydrofolate reductase